MQAKKKDCGLIYLRRSDDRQETSLMKQLTWALEAVRQQGVQVEAAIDDLKIMQAKRLC